MLRNWFANGPRSVFLTLALVFVPSLSSAILLPDIPTTTGAIQPSAAGLDKLKAFGEHILDLVCLAGEYEQNKWLPITVNAHGMLSAMWIRGTTQFCPVGGINGYSANTDACGETHTWGFVDAVHFYQYKYVEVCEYQDGGGVVAIRSGMDTGDYRCSYPSSHLPFQMSASKIIGRGVQNRTWQTAGGCEPVPYTNHGTYYTSCCQDGGTDCKSSVWCTIITSTDTNAGVQVSTAELSNLYVPNPYPFNPRKFVDGIWDGYGGVSGPSLAGSDTDAATTQYEDYLNKGYFQLDDTDITTYLDGIPTSTSVINNQYTFTSSTTVNVDLSTTNQLLDGILTNTGYISSHTTETNVLLSSISAQLSNIGTSSGTVISTAAYWGMWQDFEAQYSSMPATLFNNLIPVSSDTWTPCFDMSSLWSGLWAGSKPSGQSSTICLTDFTGWDTFMNLVRCLIFLIFAFWGVWGIWSTLTELRVPGLFNAGDAVLSVTVAVVLTGAVASLSYFVYAFVLDKVIYVAATVANCYGACAGFHNITNPGVLVLMMNYCGFTQAAAAYMTLVGARWNLLLFLNFWGCIRR